MQFAGSIGWLLFNWLTDPLIDLFIDWLTNWKLNVPTKHRINQLTESKELNNMINWKNHAIS